MLCLMVPAVALTDADIVDRIKKTGEICLQGEDCGGPAMTAVADTAAAGAASPESNYNSTCATCHASGAAGAPMLNDASAWEPRIAKGTDVLYGSVINGLGAMPAKGMCFSCSDDDLKALVDYMLASVEE